MQIRPVIKSTVFSGEELSETPTLSLPISISESSESSLWVYLDGTLVDSTISILCGPDRIAEHFAVPSDSSDIVVSEAGAHIFSLSLPITRFVVVSASGDGTISAIIQHA